MKNGGKCAEVRKVRVENKDQRGRRRGSARMRKDGGIQELTSTPPQHSVC